MALLDQVIPVNLGVGQDTKTDPKQVQGKYISVQNGVFTNPGSVEKRNGYTSIPNAIAPPFSPLTLVSPTLVKSYNEELTCADSSKFYSFSENLQQWVYKGNYVSASVQDVFISRTYADEVNSTGAVLGNYTLVGYAGRNLNYTNGNTTPSAFFSVLDTQTNTLLQSDRLLASTGVTITLGTPFQQNVPKCLALSGSLFGMFAISTAASLQFYTYNPATNALSGATSIGTVAVTNSVFNYDAIATPNGCVVVWDEGSGVIGVTAIDTTGAITHTTTITSAGTVSPLSVSTDAAGNAWVMWFDSGSSEVKYAIFSPTLTVVLATTNYSNIQDVVNITAISISATTQRIYVTDTFNAPAPYPSIGQGIISQAPAGNVNLTRLYFNLANYAKPVMYNGDIYLTVSNYSPTQATLFLVNQTTQLTVAKCLAARAEPVGRAPSALSNIFLSSTNVLTLVAGVIQQNSLSGNADSDTIAGTALINFNFADSECYQAYAAGNNLVLNGGIVSSYDGVWVTELGFNVYPEPPRTGNSSSTGGNISNGTYTYVAVYRWFDAQGNLHQSSPSLARTVTLSGGTATQEQSMSIQTLPLTQKGLNSSIFGNSASSPVQLLLYRNAPSAGGQTSFFLVSDLNFPALNDTTLPEIAILDVVSDAVLIGNEPLYTNGGVVENISPPPATTVMINQNRVWLVDSENPNTDIWYCKTIQPNVGISFSDILKIQVDAKFGSINALSPMDEKSVLMKETGHLFFTGDGANDTGAGSTISNPQVIPTDTGCLQSRGVILIPKGVIFKSEKGLYMLDRGLNIIYLGMDVQADNPETITNATMVPNTSQVRFLTSSGNSIVYDYIFEHWGTFTNHQGYSADNWNGTYVYLRTDGAIYLENSTSFLDDTTPYALTAQTSWLKFAGIQGFQRVKQLLLLGDHNSPAAGHGVSISIAYNFNQATFQTPVVFALTANSVESPFQYRKFFAQQKCDSVSLLITEVTTGASAEYIDFTDLSLLAGVKKGLHKLSAANSVG